MPEHIGICGPVASKDIASLLGRPAQGLPLGYEGAPLMVTLVRTLLERGHRVTVVTLSRDLRIDEPSVQVGSSIHPGLRVVFCALRSHAWRPVQGRPGRILDFYRVERALMVQALQEARPDVVHAHWLYEFAWAALTCGLPSVVTSHDSPWVVARMNALAKPTISLYRGLRLLMARRVLRLAQRITAVSPYMHDEIAARTTARIQVIPNPVDGYPLELGSDRQLGERCSIALICNGWSHLKNAEVSMRAFALLAAERPAVRLHLFGHDFEPQGRAWRWCQAQPDVRAHLEAMTFHGPMPHRALIDALAGCDLLLHSSREETFGLVLAEAMGLGIPVVGGERSGAVPWVIQDPRCLCDIEDPAALAAAARRVLEPATYAELSRQLRESVRQRFSREGVVAQYVDVYRQALAEAGGRA